MTAAAEQVHKPRFLRLLSEAIGTGFGIGYWPVAPATAASAAAVLIYWALPFEGSGDSTWFFLMIAVWTAIGVWATGYITMPFDPDPKRGVADEWVGQWVTLLFLPASWPWLLAGFAMFRVMDILKPFGVRRLEALPGGFGVMADDIGAAILGAVILNAVRLIFFA